MGRWDREKRFWNNYLATLAEHHFKSFLDSWYVRHCKTFIRKNKDTRLKQHTSKSVIQYQSRLKKPGSEIQKSEHCFPKIRKLIQENSILLFWNDKAGLD